MISLSYPQKTLRAALLTLAGTAASMTPVWAANGDVTVTQLTSFHGQGEDVTTESGPQGWPSASAPNAPPLYAVNPSTRVARLFGGFQGGGPLRAANGSLSALSSTAPGLYWLAPTPGLYERLELGASDLYGLIAGKPVASADGSSLYGVMVSRYGESYRDKPDLLDTDGNVAIRYSLQYSKTVGQGLLFRTDADGTHMTALAGSAGKLYTPNGALTIDAAGNLYGIDKGPQGNGRIFKLGADGNFQTVHEFGTAPNGRKQVANDLLLGSDGLLYGVTAYDRGLPLAPDTPTALTTPVGTLYRIDPAYPAASFRVLHTFTLAEGEINTGDNVSVLSGRRYPTGEPLDLLTGEILSSYNSQGLGLTGLVEGADGWLYGTTSIPTCITYSPYQASATSSTTMALPTPLCGLKHHPASRYIAAYPYYDGPVAHGAVYRIHKDGTNVDGAAGIQIVHKFSDLDGSTPRGPLAVGKDGAIYGTTLSGGSNQHWVLLTTLRLNRPPECGDFVLSSWQIECTAQGKENYARLQSVDQPLRDGVLYRIVPSKIAANGSGGFELLHSFKHDVDGFRPLGLSAGSDGRLYGVSATGGQGYLQRNGIVHLNDDKGTVFQVDIEGNVPSANVRLVAAPSSISAGQKTTLTWTSFQAGSCVASSSGNDWTGAVGVEGSVDLTPRAGTYRYQITCRDTVKNLEISAIATVYVDTVASVDDGNKVQYGNGGGAIGLSLLPLLAIAGLARRRRQARD